MENISKAIIEVMKDIENISKNTTVGKGSNAYKAVSDADVKRTMRESMIKNGLSILQVGVIPKVQIDRWEEIDTYSKDTPKPMKTKQSCFTEIQTKYLLLHTSGENIQLAGYGQGVDSQDKGAGKATTYALKNTLLNIFLVPTGEDTDNTHSESISVPQISKPKNWLNFEDFEQIIEAGNTTEQQIAKVIKDDGYSLSGNAKNAVRHYVETGELDKNLFFKKK